MSWQNVSFISCGNFGISEYSMAGDIKTDNHVDVQSVIWILSVNCCADTTLYAHLVFCCC